MRKYIRLAISFIMALTVLMAVPVVSVKADDDVIDVASDVTQPEIDFEELTGVLVKIAAGEMTHEEIKDYFLSIGMDSDMVTDEDITELEEGLKQMGDDDFALAMFGMMFQGKIDALEMYDVNVWETSDEIDDKTPKPDEESAKQNAEERTEITPFIPDSLKDIEEVEAIAATYEVICSIDENDIDLTLTRAADCTYSVYLYDDCRYVDEMALIDESEYESCYYDTYRAGSPQLDIFIVETDFRGVSQYKRLSILPNDTTKGVILPEENTVYQTSVPVQYYGFETAVRGRIIEYGTDLSTGEYVNMGNSDIILMEKGDLTVPIAEGASEVDVLYEYAPNVYIAESIEVQMDTTPPCIAIVNYTEHIYTDEQKYMIKGIVSDGNVELTVRNGEDGVPVTVRKDDGSFGIEQILTEGHNEIIVSSRDNVGNISELKMIITYPRNYSEKITPTPIAEIQGVENAVVPEKKSGGAGRIVLLIVAMVILLGIPIALPKILKKAIKKK